MRSGAEPSPGIRDRGLAGWLFASLLLHLLLLPLLISSERQTASVRDMVFVHLAGELKESSAGRRFPSRDLSAGAGQSRARTSASTTPAPTGSDFKTQPDPPVVHRQGYGAGEHGSERPASAVPVPSASLMVKVAGEGPGGRTQTPFAAITESNSVNGAESVVGGSGAPDFLHRAVPVYPSAARRFGREGAVTLRLTIDQEGRLERVDVVKGFGYGFTESAIIAIRRSTFTPAVKEGQGVVSRALVTVRFVLHEP